MLPTDVERSYKEALSPYATKTQVFTQLSKHLPAVPPVTTALGEGKNRSYSSLPMQIPAHLA